MYRVALEVFEGPLDLLLHLIEREELDITAISLAVVADQYLGHISALRELSAANLSDFLVVAAKLLVIKSRALLPRPQEEDNGDEEEEDPAEELAQQLLEYKRFKEVAEQLKNIEERGLKAYPRIAPPPHLERHLKPGEVSLTDLLVAFKRVLEAHPPMPPVDDIVSPVTVRIADCIQRIIALTTNQKRVRFTTVMRAARSRLEIIVSFMAVLEMIKQQRLQAVQEHRFGEIYLELREPDPAAAAAPVDLSEYGEE